MKKVKKCYFRIGTVYDGGRYFPRPVRVADGFLFLGGRRFNKARIREMLKARKGSFRCVYRYIWKFNRDGSIAFGAFGRFHSTLPKRLVDRIRKWARSR